MNIYEYMGVGAEEKPLDRIVTDGGFFSIFRTVACIGDSLSSGEFESLDENGTSGYHDFYPYSWGQFIARSAGSLVYNFSRGGMTAKAFVESYAKTEAVFSKEKAAQAYIIALGVNDIINRGQTLGSVDALDGKEPLDAEKSFAYYYAEIIEGIKAVQERAKIFLVTMPREKNEKDAMRRAHRDLLAAFAERYSNTYLIDLYTFAPPNDHAFKETYWLGHMTPTGYVLTARMIESYIDYIIRKNPKEFSQVGFIGTDLYYKEKR